MKYYSTSGNPKMWILTLAPLPCSTKNKVLGRSIQDTMDTKDQSLIITVTLVPDSMLLPQLQV
jgi:hypothetical protein